MISVRLYKRRKRICQTTVLWISASILAMLGAMSASLGLKGGGISGRVVPAMDQSEPDVPQMVPVTPQVNGDGVLDTPGLVAKLMPALADEAFVAVRSGDARQSASQFCHWIATGEALHSQPFWLFWSIVGLGIIAVMGCSLVEHFMEWRHRLGLRKAGGPEGAAPAAGAEKESTGD